MTNKNKHIGKLIISIIMVIAIVVSMAVIFVACGDNTHALMYHDIDLYISGEYLTSDFTNDLRCASAYRYSSKFFPVPNDMDEELNYDFYIYDGKANMTHTAVTVVFDVIYSDRNRYSTDKQEISNRYTYLMEYNETTFFTKIEFSFQLDNFECHIVDGEGYTNYPSYFGIFCYNDSDLILRYYFFYELEAAEYPQKISYYKDCSNCSW